MIDPDPFDRPAPWSLDAERAVISACIRDPAYIRDTAEIALPGDFYQPQHQVIWETLVRMWFEDVPVSLLTLTDRLHRDGLMREAGGREHVLSLAGLGWAGVQAGVHAQIVHGLALKRTLIETFTRGIQLAYELDTDPADIMGQIDGAVLRAADRLAESSDPLDGQVTADDFAGRFRVHAAPVVPGLLHERDRVVIVGGEGLGKTTLAVQLAVTASAGVHVFMHSPVPPKRTLIIDLENPRDLLQTELASQVRLARGHDYDPDRLRIWSVPEGIDLGQAADQFRLVAQIRAARPDLIVAGPVYKMFADKGPDSDAGMAYMVSQMWDRLRKRYGFALWLETHPSKAGRRSMTPGGSGLWMRWPEAGISMQSAGADAPAGAVRLRMFRPPRRPGMIWPEEIHRALTLGATWPWTGKYAPRTLDVPMPMGESA